MRSPREVVESVPRSTAVVVGAISGSQFVNHAYLVLLPPILTVLATDFEVTLATLGVVLGVQGLTNTLFQLPFGYLADSYDRTLALAVSSFVGAAGVLVVAAAPSFAWLVVGQAIIGIGVAGHHPAHYPLLADATPDGLRGRAYSVYGVGGSLGFAAAPTIITVTIGVPGLTWRHAVGFMGVVGLLYAVAVTALFATSVDDEITRPNVDRAELRSLVANPGILALAALALLASTANWGLTSYAVVFLTDAYGVPLRLANFTLTGIFLVGAVAIVLGGDLTDRFAPGPVIVASFAGLTLLVGLIAARLVPALAAVGLFLLVGGVRSLSGPARDALSERLSATGSVGRSFAIITVGIMLGSAVAPPLFGVLIERSGVGVAFGAVAAVAGLATLLTVGVVTTYADEGTTATAAD
jgi:predicted MFS family arabinose efflux permease